MGSEDVPYVYPYSNPWEDREAQGYFDLDAGGGVELLKGVTFADCGNVTILPLGRRT